MLCPGLCEEKGPLKGTVLSECVGILAGSYLCIRSYSQLNTGSQGNSEVSSLQVLTLWNEIPWDQGGNAQRMGKKARIRTASRSSVKTAMAGSSHQGGPCCSSPGGV